MQQNTTEWLKWRNEGIGASDAPIIMGISPHKTVYQLWLEKTGIEKIKDDDSYILKKGQHLENVIREKYNNIYGVNAVPQIVENPKVNWLRASLDGYHDNIVVEMKYVGQNVVEKGEVVEHHYPQLLHQLMASGAKKVRYVLYNDISDTLKVIEVEPNREDMERLYFLEKKFWDMVQNREEPALTDKDSFEIKSKKLKSKIDEWRKIKEKLDTLAIHEKALKTDIEKDLVHTKNTYENITISKVIKKGAVDYSKIPELKGVNLEVYRKTPSTYYKFSISKQKRQG